MSVAVAQDSTYDPLIAALRAGQVSWRGTPIGERVALLRRARRRLAGEAPKVFAAARAAEDVPADGRYLGGLHLSLAVLPILMRAYEDALTRMQAGLPPVPHRAVSSDCGGRVTADVFPSTPTDRLLYSAWGYRARVLMQQGVTPDQVVAEAGGAYRDGDAPAGGVALALGPGNTSSGPAMDIVDLLIGSGCTVVAKLNPTNSYLRPSFERVFGEFVAAGWLRFADGGADVGTALAHHPGVDRIHLTGSADTYRALRWGTSDDRDRNLAAGTPALDKPITAELGGVGPMIVAPGRWTRGDLRRQADRILGARTIFGGHTCNAPQILILPQGWTQAADLLAEIRHLISQQIPGQRYYPGTEARASAALAGLSEARELDRPPRRTILVELDPDTDPWLCRHEVFTDVLGVVRLPANSVAGYLAGAAAYANDRLPGTLCASLLVDPGTLRDERRAVGRAIAEMRYGSIGLNEWGAGVVLVGYPPWGAFPGHTPQDPGSGFGFVHNACMLSRPEKTVFTGRFRAPVKPIGAATHRTLEPMGRALIHFLCTDDPRVLPAVLAAAARA